MFLLPAGWTRRDGSAIVLAGSDKLRVEFTRGLGACGTVGASDDRGDAA